MNDTSPEYIYRIFQKHLEDPSTLWHLDGDQGIVVVLNLPSFKWPSSCIIWLQNIGTDTHSIIGSALLSESETINRIISPTMATVLSMTDGHWFVAGTWCFLLHLNFLMASMSKFCQNEAMSFPLDREDVLSCCRLLCWESLPQKESTTE
jgi:hypothetical protein